MAFIQTMATPLTHGNQQRNNSDSTSTDSTGDSITPPLLTHGVNYRGVTSIPNLLNYDRQTGSGIRSVLHEKGEMSSQSGEKYGRMRGMDEEAVRKQRNYEYGTGHRRGGSLDFLAEAAIDQDRNQEEFKGIISKLSEYRRQISESLTSWNDRNIKDISMEDLAKFVTDTKVMLKYSDRLLEIRNQNESKSNKPQLPSIDQLKSEIQRPRIEFQFPMKNPGATLFNVNVKNLKEQVPGISSTKQKTTGKKNSMGGTHRTSKSDSSIPTSHTFRVDKVKTKKRNSITQLRKVSVAAGDGTESCKHCHETVTPEWRRGPYGNRTLCNACGLFYCKLVKKFNSREANILMHYRKAKGPEDRRVPESLDVPESFIKSLEMDDQLDENFNFKSQ